MIGTLTLNRSNGSTVTAELDDDGAWTSNEDAMAIYLNACHNPSGDGPSTGRYGCKALADAAAALSATYEFGPVPTDGDESNDPSDSEAETVY